MLQQSRKVGFRTIFDWVKLHPVSLRLSIIFTFIPLFIGSIFYVLISGTQSEAPDVDYDLVMKEGNQVVAIIDEIQMKTNVSINDEHPAVIRYHYQNGSQQVKGISEVLAQARVEKLNVGDSIDVKFVGSTSVLAGYEPFRFPLQILVGFFAFFLLIALIFASRIYWKVSKQIKLFKFGEVRNAEVVSMERINRMPFVRGSDGLLIHYHYKNRSGAMILGESISTDYTILNTLKQGDTVKIMVLPEDESQSGIISKLDVLRNGWKMDFES